MAVSTNLGLYLPTREDYISVKRDLSDNYEVIDEHAGMMEKGSAIVVNGDTAPKSITSGQYLLIKNHSTLASGSYHATTNIANGATINNSNVAIDTNGIANALKSEINTLISKLGSSYSLVTLASGITGTVYIMRMGNLRVLSGYVNSNTSGASITIATLDTTDRPPVNVRGSYSGYGVAATGEFTLSTNGVLELAISATPSNTVKFNITYAIA